MAWLAQAAVAAYTANQASQPQNSTSSGITNSSSDPWYPTIDMRNAGLTRLWDLMGGGYNPSTTAANGNVIPGAPNYQMGGYVGASGANMISGQGRGPRAQGSWLADPNAAGGGAGGGGAIPPGGSGGFNYRQAGNEPRPMGQGGGGGGLTGSQQPLGPRPGRGGGGGQPAGGGFNGQSQATADLIGALSDRAAQGHQLYQPANDATQGVLEGEDPNIYRPGVMDVYSGMANGGADVDPYLRRFLEEEFGGGGAGGMGGGGGGGGFSYNASGGGGAPGMVGVQKDLRAILDGKFLGQQNPELQAMIDKAARGTREQFMREKIPGINDQFAGSGMFGGSAWQNATGQAGAGLAQALADQESGLRFQDYESARDQYNQALGLGTQYDMNATDNETARASAASAAGASAYGANLQAQNARRGMLLDAIGMGTNLRQAGAAGMGALSNDFGTDWRFALGMVPDLSGLDVRDLQAAGGLSLGSDNARNDFISSQNQLRAAQASAGNARAQLKWDQYKYNREAPMSDLAAYADIINRFSQGGGQSQSDTFNRNRG